MRAKDTGGTLNTPDATDVVSLGDLTKLVKSVEVEIGGQKIDKHYGAWLDIYNELFETNHDYSKNMVGGASTVPTRNPGKVEQELFIPLRFWFNRNPGLALPLIALQYHEVKVKVDLATAASLNDVVSLSVAGATAAPATAVAVGTALPTASTATADKVVGATLNVSMVSPQLLVNYVYLDTDERRRFAQVSHEYLIEQVQHTGADSGSGVLL